MDLLIQQRKCQKIKDRIQNDPFRFKNSANLIGSGSLLGAFLTARSALAPVEPEPSFTWDDDEDVAMNNDDN